MIQRSVLETICKDLQQEGYSPIIRPQPVQGVIDLVIIQSGSGRAAQLRTQVLREVPFRAFLDEDGCFRTFVAQRYQVPTYGLNTNEATLNPSIRQELKDNIMQYIGLEADEREACARLRVVYREVRAGEDSVVVAVLPEHLLNSRVYDVLCPQSLSEEMVHGIGIAVLNPPKQKGTIELRKGRHAEDVPELRRLADDFEQRAKKAE